MEVTHKHAYCRFALQTNIPVRLGVIITKTVTFSQMIFFNSPYIQFFYIITINWISN